MSATCSYSEDGTTLYCGYAEHWCETTASCNRAVYERVPAGLVARRSLHATPLARWLADGAHLEATSVPAFEDLAAELDAFGAPSVLSRAARRSADDERGHARMLHRLADRLGADVAAVRRTETAPRSPEEVAIDNAVEGCVREAYAALAAAMQAERAGSLTVRRAYRSIAADEARHALLSFATNDWLAAQLSPRARRRARPPRRDAQRGPARAPRLSPTSCAAQRRLRP